MNKEVKPAEKLVGSLDLPPDKSISHRSALFAALHEGTSEITNFSGAADPQSTLSCLQKLGIRIEKKKGGHILVEGSGRSGLTQAEVELYCGNSGTTMRLLSGIVGGAGVRCTLNGDESLSARTMKRIIDPLSKMGITIDAQEGDYTPLHISREGPVHPISFPLPIPSAQLKSSVLLAGLFGKGDTKVFESIPSRDHTERLLDLPQEKKEGVKVIRSSSKYPIPKQNYTIPNDFSAAAFWLVAGSIHPEASIRLNSVGINPTRTAALEILDRMGATMEIEDKRYEGPEPVADLSVTTAPLSAVSITKEMVPNCIDELPVLMIAMLFAEGRSRISGAEELRHKETDRLAAMSEMLEKAGAEITEHSDGIEIEGDPSFIPNPSSFKSYDDHRIAMSAAVLGSRGSGPSTIEGAGCTAISYPSFWEHLGMLTN